MADENMGSIDKISESVSLARMAYNGIAEKYDDLFTPFQEFIMYPRIEALFGSLAGDFHGKRILDLGCGTGAFCLQMSSVRRVLWSV